MLHNYNQAQYVEAASAAAPHVILADVHHARFPTSGIWWYGSRLEQGKRTITTLGRAYVNGAMLMGNAFRVSDFTHKIQLDDSMCALYNALTLGTVFTEEPVGQTLLAGRVLTDSEIVSAAGVSGEGFLDALVQQKLIVPLAEGGADLRDLLRVQEALAIPVLGILYLILTEACNLACKYCFVETGFKQSHEFKQMSIKTAKAGVDLFARSLSSGHAPDEPQVILYGGEAFLNTQVLREVVQYISEQRVHGSLPINTSITINSNGTLINDELAQFLARIERLTVAISIDGPRDIHDTARPNKGPGGSFEAALTGYRCLQRFGVPAGVCCTISRYNVEVLPQVARWLVEELGVNSLGFNLLIEGGNADSAMDKTSEYAQKAASQLIYCFEYFREKGVYEDRMMRKVNAFVNGEIYLYDCGGCGRQIVMTPDGWVGTCQGNLSSKEDFVPLSSDFNPATHPTWERWRYRSPVMIKECRSCVALGLCGGGCPYSARQRTGTIYGLDEVFCAHAKATTEFLVRDLYRSMKNKTQPDIPPSEGSAHSASVC